MGADSVAGAYVHRFEVDHIEDLCHDAQNSLVTVVAEKAGRVLIIAFPDTLLISSAVLTKEEQASRFYELTNMSKDALEIGGWNVEEAVHGVHCVEGFCWKLQPPEVHDMGVQSFLSTEADHLWR